MKPFGKYVFWFSFPVCLMMYWNREEWLYNITLEGKRLSIFYFSRRSMHPKPLPKWRVFWLRLRSRGGGRGGEGERGGGQWATCIVIECSLMPRQIRIPVIRILVGMGEYLPIDVSQWRCHMGFGLTSTIVNVQRGLLVKTANKICISFSLLTTSYVVWFACRRLSLVTLRWPCSLIVICS